MSWLSKRFGGNTLKLGAALVGSYFGGKYLFGDSVTGGGYTGTDIASKTFNAFDITPFRDTQVGSFLSPGLDFIRDTGLGDLVTGAGGIANAMNQFSRFPKAKQAGFSRIKTDTNFQASRANQLPLGSANQRMLQLPQVQRYLAKRAQMVGLPTAKVVQPNITVGGATLKATTASKKLARSRIVS